ncbi:MAG: hypothetical protein KBA64_05215 [Armatimonadetes bacterium]|nr:hypothetical protein [Armatimonadota bacterium]
MQQERRRRPIWYTGLTSLALAIVAGVCSAGTITEGSEYWPVLQQLTRHQDDFAAMEDACERLREVEDAVGQVNRLSKPLVPALETIEESPSLKLMGRLPYVGEVTESARLTAGALRGGIEALAWAHGIDKQMVQPLTSAVYLSNGVLERKQDSDVPALLRAYEDAQTALNRGDDNLAQSLRHTRSMLRLVTQLGDVLGKSDKMDPQLIESVSQLEDALRYLVTNEEEAQRQGRRCIAFVDSVLDAAPRKRASRSARTATAPSGRATEIGEPSQKAAERPAGVGVPPAALPEVAVPSAPLAARPPSAESHGAAPVERVASPQVVSPPSRSPWTLMGGLLVLAVGLGATAWLVVQLVDFRRGRPGSSSGRGEAAR